MSGAPDHIAAERLVEYWLDELDPVATEAIDAHLLSCDFCGAELDSVIGLGAAVRGAFVEGRVPGFVTSEFVARLRESGAHVREYRIEQDGTVNCTVAPEDDFLVSRLQVQLEGVDRVDAEVQLSRQDETLRLEDVPFDVHTGEVLWVPKLTDVRQLPSTVLHIRLLAIGTAGAREIGRYTLNHQPWS